MSAAFFRGAEEIIRGRALGAETWAQTAQRAAVYLVAFGCAYGALMGSFGGIEGDRLLVLLYSALKVPLLLVVTFVVCLPSFFVLNTLFGVAGDFRAVFHALVATQAALTILLASLAPYTLFWYASSADYNAAILFNALVFGVASFGAQLLLRRHYLPLIRGNPRHRLLMRVWLVLFAFVGIQTAWVLRPFIGSPDLPAQFFREEAWSNAYVALAEKVAAVFDGD